MKTVHLAVVFGAALLLPRTALGIESRPVDGCRTLAGWNSAILVGGRSVSNAVFREGDKIFATASEPSELGPATIVSLSVDGGVVDSTSFPGTVSYEFPMFGVFDVSAAVDRGNVTWEFRCEPAPATTAPAASGTGLVLLVASLLFAGLRAARESPETSSPTYSTATAAIGSTKRL